MRERFHKIATKVSETVGSPIAFIAAFFIVVVWAFTGPIFNFSDTWQLVINTGTTIITFLMVFLIQNTQNRDGRATQLKLDELIRAVKGARDAFLDIEDISDEELEKLHAEFAKLHQRYASELEKRRAKKRKSNQAKNASLRQ